MLNLPTFDDIRAAAGRIAPLAHRTPILTCRSIDALAGAAVLFKCESFQKGGAFKFRGACNAVMSLSDAEAARGVVTHSSGNHAAALALAARLRGIPAHVVMPSNSSRAKIAAVEAYGGKVVLCEPTLESRQTSAQRVLAETGGQMIHPYDDARVIAGQGTCALEILDQDGPVDDIVVPVSGGGLVSGIALAAHGVSPGVRIIGVEPDTADDARRSLETGRLQPGLPTQTIADGLRAALCDRTFAVVREHVSRILPVSDARMIDAMRLIWSRMKIVVEPSSSITIAAVLANKELFSGRRVACILTGGNVDLDALPWR